MITSSRLILTEILFQESERMEVEGTEFSYFDLKKGEKLDYRLVAEPKAERDDMLNISTSASKAIKVSKRQCGLKEGCDF
jgi:hypothetical protein